jgi:hypothetical protein
MYTYRIEEENGNPVAWIDVDGNPSIYQPHHPNAANYAPWSSAQEAEAWAVAQIEQLSNPPAPAEKEEL